MAPERIADLVEEMSDGQMKITVYGAEEQVPAFGVFDAVSSGSHQMGHSGGYFWKGKVPAAQFFTSVPFGLTADEINAWVNRGVVWSYGEKYMLHLIFIQFLQEILEHKCLAGLIKKLILLMISKVLKCVFLELVEKY
jgi:TRAP-type mannitol/chloroaromatic compound transport system substrate-binding protein